MGSICGSSSFSFTCPHTKPSSQIPKFFKSTRSIVFSILFTLPIFINIIVCFYILFAFENNDIESSFTWCEILGAFGALGFAIPGVIKNNERLIEMNGLAEILEKSDYYGFSSLLTQEIASTFNKRCYLAAVVTLIAEIPLLTYAFTNIHTYESSMCFIFRMMVFGMNNYTQCVYVFQDMIINSFYKSLFGRCFKNIEDIMKEHNQTWKEQPQSFVAIGIFSVLPEDVSIKEILRRSRSLYTSLIYNYEQMNKFMGLPILIWWIVVIASFIINFHVLVLLYSVHSTGDFFITMRTYGGVVGIIIYLNITQGVFTVSEDILSFLFKYPISKLSPAEAAQVEMLITTLTIQKPVLRASDIFTIGTRLLASISGTVVTYVLVALQFHPAWGK